VFGKQPAPVASTAVASVESKQAQAFGTLSSSSSSSSPATVAAQPPAVSTAAATADKAASVVDPDFLAHLKALNVQVTEWIRRHIEDNPLVILSPVFKDYETHLKEITEKFPPTSAAVPPTAAEKTTADAAAPAAAAAKPFTFGLASGKKEDEPAAPTGFKVASFYTVGTVAHFTLIPYHL
jgi:nuclear pore complex protein Nup50